MNVMTDYQRELAAENLAVVDCVIRRRIGVKGISMMEYEDYYSVGSEALCRAAMTYKPESGSFIPYASITVYNAIVDYCRKQGRHLALHVDLELQDDFDMASLNFMSVEDGTDEKISYQDLLGTLAQCKKKYSGVVLRGIEALELKSMGFTTGEIAKKHGTTVNSINAWISKARARLCEDPDFLAAIAEMWGQSTQGKVHK